MMVLNIIPVFLLFSHTYAATVGHDLFGHSLSKGQLTDARLDDISGLCASRVHSNILYVHNYQGDGNFIYAIDTTTAKTVATFVIQGAQNFDWEDIAYGPCADDCRNGTCGPNLKPARYCIYIADIGSHGGVGAANVIYMVREPSSMPNGTATTVTLSVVDKLSFSWSEPDAESLIVTPDARLFVISKVPRGRAMIAELPSSGWGSTVTLDLSKTGILKVYTPHYDPQGADLSPDGTELIFIAEEEVFYYKLTDGNFINAIRTQVPSSVYSYQPVPDTEGIAWSPDGMGFYVIARSTYPIIYYYPKDLANGPGVGR